ncbi:hypothetical protein Tco_0369128 [Tanacetum coccineum]
MNQNFYVPNLCYNSISSSFDQFQPSQFPVIHQPPQETNTEMLQAIKNLMKAIQAFLKKYDQIPPKEKSMALLLAEERFLKVKGAVEEGQNQPENVQEFLLKLLNDLRILNKMQLKQEEEAAKICTPYWKCPIFVDDDDEEYTIQDVHLDTISETESNKEYESSVEDLNLTPSESEDLSEDLSDIEKSNLIESLLKRDTSIISSPKFDSLLEEFSDELAHIDLISTEIDEADFDPEEEIRGSDSLMEEIDIFLAPDDSIPPGIENDDYDSEGDILEELLNNDSLKSMVQRIENKAKTVQGTVAGRYEVRVSSILEADVEAYDWWI